MTRARDLADSADLNFDNGTFVVDQTNNRVGVGTTSPDSALEIQTATNSSSDTTYLKLSNLGENVGHIDFENGNGNLARITGTKLGAGASANDGILTFSASLDSVLTEHMRIDGATGNAGIGLNGASPASKLHVNGSFRQTGATAPFEWTVNAGASDYYKLNSVGYSDNIIVANALGNVGIGTVPAQRLHIAGSAVQFQNTQSTYLQINTTDTHLYTAGSHPLRFGTNGIERLRITSTGKLETQGRNFGFHNHGTQVSLADDASIVINAGTAGGGILAIYETASGQWANFGVGFNGASIMSALNSANFDVIDTDGRICVIATNHTITIKNRLGGTKGFYINMFMAGNNFAG